MLALRCWLVPGVDACTAGAAGGAADSGVDCVGVYVKVLLVCAPLWRSGV